MRMLPTLVVAALAGALIMAPADAARQQQKQTASKQAKSSKSVGKTRVVFQRGRKPVYVAQTERRTERHVAKYEPAIHSDDEPLQLESNAVVVFNEANGQVLYSKNDSQRASIASITKLMTAMVTLDAAQPLDETITITDEDVDQLKGSSSRLTVGSTLTRREMLLLALMSSENRAAHSLGRTYPGGLPAFVRAMNRKAKEIGMRHARFYDPTGLHSGNSATASDLVAMVQAASDYPMIRRFSTTPSYEILTFDGRLINYQNTNALIRDSDWEIGLQKTGFIREAGKCLVMQTKIAGQPVVIVLLDASASAGRLGDANRIRRWMETTRTAQVY